MPPRAATEPDEGRKGAKSIRRFCGMSEPQTDYPQLECSHPVAARGLLCHSYSTCLKAVGERYWNIGVPGGSLFGSRNVESNAQFRKGGL